MDELESIEQNKQKRKTRNNETITGKQDGFKGEASKIRTHLWTGDW